MHYVNFGSFGLVHSILFPPCDDKTRAVGARRLFDGLSRDAVTIDNSQFLVGTGNDCHLRPFSPLVSQHHCEIKMYRGRATVRDLESQFGTWLNCKQVRGTCTLRTGDTLNVGLAFYSVLIIEEASNLQNDSLNRSMLPKPHLRLFDNPIPVYNQSVQT